VQLQAVTKSAARASFGLVVFTCRMSGFCTVQQGISRVWVRSLWVFAACCCADLASSLVQVWEGKAVALHSSYIDVAGCLWAK
jgi:hypothetical protein